MQIRWKGPAMMYGGKRRAKGDEFNVPQGLGRVFVAIGRATIATPSAGAPRETRVMEPPPPPQAVPVVPEQPTVRPVDPRDPRGITDAEDEPMVFGGQPEASDRRVVGTVRTTDSKPAPAPMPPPRPAATAKKA